MYRFHLNRLWTLLLALFLSVAGVSVLSNVAHSDAGNGGWSGDNGEACTNHHRRRDPVIRTPRRTAEKPTARRASMAGVWACSATVAR